MTSELKQNGEERAVAFIPLGEKTEVKLTIGMVRQFLAVKTKRGKEPSDQDIVKYMMLCKARELNPWVGDAYLIGYDANDGPVFNLITSIQSLLKRAEVNQAFDGIESGVIVLTESGMENREGDLVLDDEKLVGGWARCWRKDRSKPFYDSLKFSVYSTGQSRWNKDPAGMIVKCAEAAVLRKAFPTQLGGLLTADEMEHVREGTTNGNSKSRVSRSDLNDKLLIDVQSVAPDSVDEPATDDINPNSEPSDADIADAELLIDLKARAKELGCPEDKLQAVAIAARGEPDAMRHIESQPWRRVRGERGNPKPKTQLFDKTPSAQGA